MKTYEKIEFKNRMSEEQIERFKECESLCKLATPIINRINSVYIFVDILLYAIAIVLYISNQNFFLMIITGFVAIFMFVSFFCFEGDIGFHYYKTRHKEDYPIEEFEQLNSLHQTEVLVKTAIELEDVCIKQKGSFSYQWSGLSISFVARYADENGDITTRCILLPVSQNNKNIKITVPIYDLETRTLYIPEGEV